jgi:hypothetical protein
VMERRSAPNLTCMGTDPGIAATLAEGDRRLVDNLKTRAGVLRVELARSNAARTELALIALIERMLRRP